MNVCRTFACFNAEFLHWKEDLFIDEYSTANLPIMCHFEENHHDFSIILTPASYPTGSFSVREHETESPAQYSWHNKLQCVSSKKFFLFHFLITVNDYCTCTKPRSSKTTVDLPYKVSIFFCFTRWLCKRAKLATRKVDYMSVGLRVASAFWVLTRYRDAWPRWSHDQESGSQLNSIHFLKFLCYMHYSYSFRRAQY